MWSWVKESVPAGVMGERVRERNLTIVLKLLALIVELAVPQALTRWSSRVACGKETTQ